MIWNGLRFCRLLSCAHSILISLVPFLEIECPLEVECKKKNKKKCLKKYLKTVEYYLSWRQISRATFYYNNTIQFACKTGTWFSRNVFKLIHRCSALIGSIDGIWEPALSACVGKIPHLTVYTKATLQKANRWPRGRGGVKVLFHTLINVSETLIFYLKILLSSCKTAQKLKVIVFFTCISHYTDV